MTASSVNATFVEGGRVLRVALARPPRNILDSDMLEALTGALDLARDQDLHAILLTADGDHFSYGASVAEHAPATAPAMLDRFATAVQALLEPDLPIVAAVRGQCLGAGLELASLATRVVAHSAARLGQPEIRLAAFAPVASIVLPRRIGQARAEDLLLTGRSVDAEEALRIGLVDAVVDGNPETEALEWIHASLLGTSASALRIACRAARAVFVAELSELLPLLVDMYRRDLLTTEDAEEGVRAFMEKRAPRWSHA